MSRNIETVNTYLDGFRKNDHEQILSCLTDDIEWTVFGAFHLIGKEAYDKAIDGAPEFIDPPELEVVRMVEQGVASARDIDTAMELGYNHPVGPLKLTDMVGLDVRLSIAEYLHETLGDRFAPPQILRDMVARGELGRKSGKGFFDWTD